MNFLFYMSFLFIGVAGIGILTADFSFTYKIYVVLFCISLSLAGVGMGWEARKDYEEDDNYE